MHAAVPMGMVVGVAVRVGSRPVRSLCWSVRGMCFFAKIDRAEFKFAKESHEPQAEHIKRSEPGCQYANAPDHGSAVWTVKDSAQNFVFAEEAGKRRNSGNG